MGTIFAMARFSVVAGALALAGCNTEGGGSDAAISRLIVGEYVNIEPVEVRLGAEVYRVIDNPSIKKMIVTRPIVWILAHGPYWTPKEPYEAAAVQHLANTGRSSCRITEFRVVRGPKHEAKYECTPLTTTSAKPQR